MSLEILNTPYIQNKIKHTGEKVLFVVTLLLFLDHIRIINFENAGFGWINTVLWIYLLINIGGVNVLKYWENKGNPTCPKCHRCLLVIKEYKYNNCGRLSFSEKN